MVKYEEIEITIKSGKISALAFGPKDGKPILAAHGWLDNAASFIPLAEFLSDHRLISIDLPGHGYSAHKPGETYMHFVDYVPDIISVIDELNWDTCSLLGHSLGAAILSIIAGVIPNRVDKLIILDAIGPYHTSAAHLPDLMLQSIKEYKKLELKKLPSYDSIQDAIKARLTASPMNIDSVEHLVNRGLELHPDQKYRWRTDPRLLIKSLIMFTEDQVDSFLSRITSPTCLIRSTHGWPFTEESYEHRRKIIKNLEIHKVDGRHHFHMDSPDKVGKIINKFLYKY